MGSQVDICTIVRTNRGEMSKFSIIVGLLEVSIKPVSFCLGYG